MSGVSTVTTKGQVTIPELLRRYLNISAGDKVYFEADPDSQVVKVKKITGSIVDQLAGSLQIPAQFSDMEPNEMIEAAKKEHFSSRKI